MKSNNFQKKNRPGTILKILLLVKKLISRSKKKLSERTLHSQFLYKNIGIIL